MKTMFFPKHIQNYIGKNLRGCLWRQLISPEKEQQSTVMRFYLIHLWDGISVNKAWVIWFEIAVVTVILQMLGIPKAREKVI